MIALNDDINSSDFFIKDDNENRLSILYFTASWCGPCKKIFPLINKLSEYNKEYFNYYIIDIDVNDILSNKFTIESVPTFILLNNETKLVSFSGSDINKFKNLLKVGISNHKNIYTNNITKSDNDITKSDNDITKSDNDITKPDNDVTKPDNDITDIIDDSIIDDNLIDDIIDGETDIDKIITET